MKKIAVINDLSGFGKCSLSVALPVISAMGLECVPLPTAILSNQTGFNEFYSIDFTPNLEAYINVWKRQKVIFDSILTGYLASEKQVDIFLDFIDHFGTNSLIFVDPVMADDGVLYDTYDKTLCKKVKMLTQKANIITPNLTELCILCGADFNKISRENSLEKIGNLAKSLLSDTTRSVIITGIKTEKEIINLIVEENAVQSVKSRLLDGSFSGTGDIFSSVVCGAVTKGKSLFDAVSLATEFISKAIKSTPTKLQYEPDGVNFQEHMEMLISEK